MCSTASANPMKTRPVPLPLYGNYENMLGELYEIAGKILVK